MVCYLVVGSWPCVDWLVKCWPSVGQVLAMCWPLLSGRWLAVLGWGLVGCVLAVVAFTPVVSFGWFWLLVWLIGVRFVGEQTI